MAFIAIQPRPNGDSAQRREMLSYIENGFQLTRTEKCAARMNCSGPSTSTKMAYDPSIRTALPQKTKQPWHAVSVVGGLGACPSAIALQGKRVLSDDAPRLPLPNCPWSWKCKCTYRHYSDRRATARRASDRGLASRGVIRERRELRGRRADDLV